jgi:hypothetical protein
MDSSGRLVRNENIRVFINDPSYMFDEFELAREINQVVVNIETTRFLQR